MEMITQEIDYSRVTPINQKRIVAFLNCFVTSCVAFLNRFSVTCERKLMTLNDKLTKLESSLSILEAKLNSVPGLDDIVLIDSKPPPVLAEAASNENSEKQGTNKDETPSKAEPVAPPAKPAVPDYLMKYMKMVNMGVPEGAVKQKMAAEGHNPDLLDKIRQGEVIEVPTTAASSSEESDFSD